MEKLLSRLFIVCVLLSLGLSSCRSRYIYTTKVVGVAMVYDTPPMCYPPQDNGNYPNSGGNGGYQTMNPNWQQSDANYSYQNYGGRYFSTDPRQNNNYDNNYNSGNGRQQNNNGTYTAPRKNQSSNSPNGRVRK